jgi:hypothetical protein
MEEIKAKFEVPEPPLPVIDELATVEPEEVKEPCSLTCAIIMRAWVRTRSMCYL